MDNRKNRDKDLDSRGQHECHPLCGFSGCQERIVLDLNETLRKLGIRPSRNRGQHFLRSQDCVDKIISFAELDGDETVLEIGAGPGILTFPLAEHARRVIAIELEPAFAGYLEKEARKRGLDNLVVIRGDALSEELPAFDKIVSNLPYSISSPLTFRILPLDFELGILMYQKEFAQRLIAAPGTKKRGSPTLKLSYYAKISPLLEVSKTDFLPIPQVDSMVLEFRKRPFPFHLIDQEFYFKLIDIMFMHRRRKIRNSLLMGFMNLPGTGGMKKEEMKEIIESRITSGSLDRRPEELSDQETAELANDLRDCLK